MHSHSLLRLLLALAAAALFSGLSQAVAQGQAQATAQSAASASSATAASAQAGNRSADVRVGTKLKAELQSSLDTRTAKPGDQVTARVTHNVKQDGRLVVRKGDLLLGRVTSVQASAASKAGSSVGVAFDRLVSGESTTQLNATITSVLSTPGEGRFPPDDVSGSDPMMAAGPGGRGGARGGLGSTVAAGGAAAGSLGRTAGGAVGSTLDGATTATARGTLGVTGGLATPISAIRVQSELKAEQQAAFNSSLLSTRRGDLRLESGTRLQFRAAAQAEVGSE